MNKFLLKILLFILSTALVSQEAIAQTCKIVITYDQNGNRINRKQVCESLLAEDESLGAVDSIRASQFQPISTLFSQLIGSSFNVFPNPVSDILNVEVAHAQLDHNCLILLLDQYGREHFRVAPTQRKTTISIAHLADGVYYVVVFYDGKKAYRKIAKVTAACTSW